LLSELQAIFGTVILPRSVFDELQDPGAPTAVRKWVASLPGWVAVKEASFTDPKLSTQLGLGETEAINLAVELKADILLIDDLPGRKAARDRGIPVTGTLTIVLQSAILSSVELERALNDLLRLGFRASDAVLDTIREEYRAIRQKQSR
jgi:predicted nucleic acid-binding protein